MAWKVLERNSIKPDKENYRPISVLPTLSKVYERLIYY